MAYEFDLNCFKEVIHYGWFRRMQGCAVKAKPKVYQNQYFSYFDL